MSPPLGLPDETVLDIFFAAGRQKEIAAKYGVSPSTVCNIKRRHTQKAVTAPWCPHEGAAVMNASLILAAFGVVP